jgi:hypothetical protein
LQAQLKRYLTKHARLERQRPIAQRRRLTNHAAQWHTAETLSVIIIDSPICNI